MEIPLICGHDYNDEHPGVVKAVNEISDKQIEKIVEKCFINLRRRWLSEAL